MILLTEVVDKYMKAIIIFNLFRKVENLLRLGRHKANRKENCVKFLVIRNAMPVRKNVLNGENS